MKRIFFLTCALAASLSIMPASVTLDGIAYNLNDNALTAEVTYKAPRYSGDVVIPASVEYAGKTYAVTAIGESAFTECLDLLSVSIPNSVTEIGWSAFAYGNKLTSLTIPNSVKEIGNYALADIPNIEYSGSATWGDDNPMWGARCLNGYVEGWLVYRDASKTELVVCSKAAEGEITIPSSVTQLNDHAFEFCSGLTNIVIPNSITSIGYEPFNGCTGLTTLRIPNSVTEIDEYAFYDVPNIEYSGTATCPENTQWWHARSLNGYIEGSLIYSDASKTQLLACPSTTTGNIVIPNTVTSISERAFVNCDQLTSVTIPTSVTSIKQEAFSMCTGLLSLSIPASVTEIGAYAFAQVLHIEYSGSFTGNTNNSPRWGARSLNGYRDGWLVYRDASKSELVACSIHATGEITIPNTVTTIADNAFFNCSKLNAITIPNSVTSIGVSSFGDCSGLQFLTIPNSITSISDFAFYGCICLKSVNLPNQLTSIGKYAFNTCLSLKSISIPKSVTSIGDDSFGRCGELEQVHVSDLTAWCAIAFGGENANPLIQSGRLFVNGEEIKDLVIPDDVSTVRRFAFTGSTGLTSVTFPNSVTSIEAGAFLWCSGLTSITIPNSVTFIGSAAFRRCHNVKSLTLGNSVAHMEYSTFDECYGLSSILSEAVTPPEIKGTVFYNTRKNIPVYVPAESVEAYKAAHEWEEFMYILPKEAQKAVVEEVYAEPTDTSVVIAWPAAEGTTTYTITINKDEELVCTLSFDADGQIVSVFIVKAVRKTNGQQPLMAMQTTNGWRHIIDGLESNTTYAYTVSAMKEEEIIYSQSGTFSTDMSQKISNANYSDENSGKIHSKLLRDGQILLQRDGKTYTVTGQEVR